MASKMPGQPVMAELSAVTAHRPLDPNQRHAHNHEGDEIGN